MDSQLQLSTSACGLLCESVRHKTGDSCRSVSFAFSTASGTSGRINFECALTSGDQKNTTAVFGACQSPVQYSDLADGQYQFYVRAQGEEIADSRAFTKVCVSSNAYLLFSCTVPFHRQCKSCRSDGLACDICFLDPECHSLRLCDCRVADTRRCFAGHDPTSDKL